MSKGEVIQLEFSAMGHDGQALGRHKGKVVFVPFGIPGEVVRARITEDRKRWSRGELLAVLEPSPQRVDPPCPFFGTCGGCHWQHIDYDAQLAYKRHVLGDQLSRVGHIDDPPVQPTLGMEEPWFYRNHVQFALTKQGQIGLQAARSHDVVPIDRCLLLHPTLDELHAALDVEWPELRRLSLRAGINTGEQMVIMQTDEEAPELKVDMPVSCLLWLGDGTELVLVGQDYYCETLRERPFCISASSFFQVNTAQTEELLAVVERFLDPEADDVLLDVYCGVGTIGLSMLEQVGRVIGIEEHPAAIRDAADNAGAAPTVTLIEGQAETVLPQLDEKVTLAVIDPPREGSKPQVLDALLRLAPRRLVYVSCNPSTLARDAARIAEGGYELVEVQPVDMFPQTYHVESVSLFVAGKQSGR
jgi:23S rRNA (uracil1939-C5)-methyltransferase